MSQENVEAVKRGLEAYNRRDVEALLEEVDPEVEWHPAFQVLLGGEPTVYRGYEGIREFFRDVDEVLAEIQGEYSEIRDLGDRIVAIGRVRTRGEASGAETESPLASVTDFENGKVIRVRSYLDPTRGPQSRRAVGVAGRSSGLAPLSQSVEAKGGFRRILQLREGTDDEQATTTEQLDEEPIGQLRLDQTGRCRRCDWPATPGHRRPVLSHPDRIFGRSNDRVMAARHRIGGRRPPGCPLGPGSLKSRAADPAPSFRQSAPSRRHTSGGGHEESAERDHPPPPARDTAQAMSQENVEIVRTAYGDYQRAADGTISLESLVTGFCDKEVEWQSVQEPSAKRGHLGVIQTFQGWFDTWEEIEIEPEEMDSYGNQVLVRVRVGGRGKQSGIWTSGTFHHLFTIRGRKVTQFREFSDRSAALEAAGLSE